MHLDKNNVKIIMDALMNQTFLGFEATVKLINDIMQVHTYN